MKIPNRDEFLQGCNEFEKHDKRDSMYKVATFLILHFWGKPPEMADGLGVLLLTWNQAFYRYGSFSFDKIERCITSVLPKITSYKNREIFNLSDADRNDIIGIFKVFLESLQIDAGKMQGKKSPVAVAKALHLLAPNFFPLWDNKIARAYGCYYNKNPAEKYFSFCLITKTVAYVVRDYINRNSDKTVIKLIDEYNYSKYTKGWI